MAKLTKSVTWTLKLNNDEMNTVIKALEKAGEIDLLDQLSAPTDGLSITEDDFNDLIKTFSEKD